MGKMQYTFSEGFYDHDDERMDFKSSIKWNKMALKFNVRRKIIDIKDKFKSKRFKLKWWALDNTRTVRRKIILKFVILKTKIRFEDVEITNSPFSESVYVKYFDARDGSFRKIRVSSHKPTRSDNSDIFITVF